ncbi:hypothetical protein [Ruminococcus sp.]|uniref:hypothetical protein n=1 Tax=Ruminococcus sp. TaxID=41978 RepID=UPI002588F0C6|nr:hypothetical protein [Ruminococcus sp.]MCR5020485.1 hypothetical protein [Ruminococcus sp.]
MILKKLLVIMTAAVLAVCAAGCGKDSGKAPKHYMAADYELDDPAQLDDWQINVLKSKGLPTDYNKLKIGQRDSIYRMGMMHRYLVDKYGIEFEYAGYYQSGFGQKEELIVMPEGADENDSRSIVSVREKDGEFSDNYGDYEILMHIEKMYDDYARDYFGSDKVKVFCRQVNDNQLSEIDFYNIDTFDFKLGIRAVVFISPEICDKDKCEAFAQSMIDYSVDKKLVGSIRISTVKDVDIAKLTNDNCCDYYTDDFLVADFEILFDDNSTDLMDCTH